MISGPLNQVFITQIESGGVVMWVREKRKREEFEAAEERACKRSKGCKPGGMFPRGLIGQVAAANGDRPRAEEERISRNRVAQEAVMEGMRAEDVTEGGETAGVVVDQEEEQMVWTVLGGEGSAPPGDALMRGLEEMGMQVEVDGAYGDAHLNTELRRLGRKPMYWGVVMHGGGTGKVVVACVVKEGTPKIRQRVFNVRKHVTSERFRWPVAGVSRCDGKEAGRGSDRG
jgi:hypothetical protein